MCDELVPPIYIYIYIYMMNPSRPIGGGRLVQIFYHEPETL